MRGMKVKVITAVFVGAVACAMFGTMPEANMSPRGAAQVFVVQPTPEYNSWPMAQAFDGKVVCAYSRGSAHTINEGRRNTYARTSADGGKTWGAEVCVAGDPTIGEVAEGCGLDEKGAMLLWVRKWGGYKGHDVYRTKDGVKFEKVSSLAMEALSPMPMQVMDVFGVPGTGLVSLWFAGNYQNKESGHSWGMLVSADNGLTWKQRVVEENLAKADWPTEICAVHLGGGRILAIARCEGGGGRQFQLTSLDGGATWSKSRTNIGDVCESTPSLIFDRETNLVSNYYYQRGAKKLKRRVADANSIFGRPEGWPEPETLADGSEKRAYDAGNVKATSCGDRHLLALYSGTETDCAVFMVSVPAPAKVAK